jgi:hypothetical protein
MDIMSGTVLLASLDLGGRPREREQYSSDTARWIIRLATVKSDRLQSAIPNSERITVYSDITRFWEVQDVSKRKIRQRDE